MLCVGLEDFAAERKPIEFFQSNTCCSNVLKLKHVNLMFLPISGIFEGNQSVDTGGVVRMSSDKFTLMKGMLDKRNTAGWEGSRIHRMDGGVWFFSPNI